jgi:hypothetical protein
VDIGNIAGQLGALFGIQPSTLLLFIMIIGGAANAGARLIPQDAVGFLGSVRKVCAVIGIYIPSRVTSGVSVTDVAQAALKTPPIPQQVDADQAADAKKP